MIIIQNECSMTNNSNNTNVKKKSKQNNVHTNS